MQPFDLVCLKSTMFNWLLAIQCFQIWKLCIGLSFWKSLKKGGSKLKVSHWRRVNYAWKNTIYSKAIVLVVNLNFEPCPCSSKFWCLLNTVKMLCSKVLLSCFNNNLEDPKLLSLFYHIITENGCTTECFLHTQYKIWLTCSGGQI